MLYGDAFAAFILSVLLLSSLLSVHGQTVQNEKDLLTQIFTTDSYNYRIRPVANQSDAINVRIELTLLSLNEVNDVAETMKTTGYLYITWTDSELTWTPASYGGLTSIFLPQDEIWKPDIVLKNSDSDYKQLGASKLNVEVSYQGLVEWFPVQVFTSTCSLDITYFPFDVQLCSLEFVAWSYGRDEVYLTSSSGVSLTEYEESAIWEILETSFSEEQISEDIIVSFNIKLKRKSLFTVITVVFPILVLTILNLFVFVLPCESGEKSGYAITVFLTFAVFLTIIESNLPENSTSIPIFSAYLIIMTAQSTIITMIALAMVRCSTFDETVTGIPKWLITLARIGKCKSCRIRLPQNKTENFDNEKVDGSRKIDEDEITMSDRDVNYTWKQVINGLDSFCFIVFTCLSVLVTVLCLAISAGVAATE